LPLGTRELLGLNVTFCLTFKQLQNNINHTIQRIAYSIRTKNFLQQNNFENNQEYIEQLCIKNRHWDPPPASNLIETKTTCFKKLLKQKHNMLITKYNYQPLSNLTPLQINALNLLKHNKNVVLKATDKNLGSAISNTLNKS
jgi:hypothetical protein